MPSPCLPAFPYTTLFRSRPSAAGRSLCGRIRTGRSCARRRPERCHGSEHEHSRRYGGGMTEVLRMAGRAPSSACAAPRGTPPGERSTCSDSSSVVWRSAVCASPSATSILGARCGRRHRVHAALGAGPEGARLRLDHLHHSRPELATVLVTHHLEELPESTTHAALIKDGGVLAAGPADEVLTPELVTARFDHPIRIEHRHGRWTARASRALAVH